MLELLSQLKLNELKAQATHAQRPPYRSWFTRFQCWIEARTHA